MVKVESDYYSWCFKVVVPFVQAEMPKSVSQTF